MTIAKLGILTGGGDAPGLNAVIRAAVRCAERRFAIETIGIFDGYKGLIEKRFTPLRGADVRDLLRQGGTVLGTSNRDNPFAYPTGDRVLDRSAEAVGNAREAGLDALMVIGGDGTLAIAKGLSELGLDVVGVPKTIDNDIGATDYTFGFWTAVGVATDALDRLRDTGESHHRVMVLEVMGRTTGWIGLHAGLAGGADVILLPEIPYTPESVARKIEERRSRGQAYSLVVVAEGAVRQGGEPTYSGVDRVTGHRRLGGAGERLAAELEDLVEHEIRVTVLGHVQRGGSPVAFDRILATRFGEQAMELVAAGRFGRMVRLDGNTVNDVPIGAGETRLVDPASELVQTGRDVGVGFGDD